MEWRRFSVRLASNLHLFLRFKRKEYDMTLTVKTTLSALKLPVVVEKNGQRYSLDIATDAEGTDLVIQKEEEVQS